MTDRYWLAGSSGADLASPTTATRFPARSVAHGRVWTARYSNRQIAASGLAPVRITAGYPRFKLDYPIAATIAELAPTRAMLAIASDTEFAAAYTQRLEHYGVAWIDEFLEIARHLGAGADPVLLCFEDIRQGKLCHRRLFAEWYESKTRQPILELEEAPMTDIR